MITKFKIKGYEEYEIYSDGRVYSNKSNKFLTWNKTVDGYIRVGVFKNNKQKSLYIHKLVAEYFIPNKNNYKHVDHIDRDKSNNTIDNLRWCSTAENNCNRTIQKTKSSGNYNGVNKTKFNTWSADVRYNGKRVFYKTFNTEFEAYIARKEYIKNNLKELFNYYYPKKKVVITKK